MEESDPSSANSGRKASNQHNQPSVRLWLDDEVSEALGLSEQSQKNSVSLMQSSSPGQIYSASLDCVRNVAGLVFFWQVFIQIRYCSQAEEPFSIKASWDMMMTGSFYFCSPMPTPDAHRDCWWSSPKSKLSNKGTVLWFKMRKGYTCRMPAKTAAWWLHLQVNSSYQQCHPLQGKADAWGHL